MIERAHFKMVESRINSEMEHRMVLAKKGDFVVDSQYAFEIGEAKKRFNQLAGIPHSYVAADDIEVGNGNKSPYGFSTCCIK